MNCTFGIVNHGSFEERYLVTDRFCYYTGQVTSSSAGQSVSPVFFKQVSVIIVRMNENTQGELVDPLSPRSELSLLSSVWSPERFGSHLINQLDTDIYQLAYRLFFNNKEL